MTQRGRALTMGQTEMTALELYETSNLLKILFLDNTPPTSDEYSRIILVKLFDEF